MNQSGEHSVIKKWSYLLEADDRLRAAERAWHESGADDALVAYVNELIRAREQVPRNLYQQYEDALLNREKYLDKKNRDNAARILAIIAKRVSAQQEPPAPPEGQDGERYQELLDWIDQDWFRGRHGSYSDQISNLAQKIEKHMCYGAWTGGDPSAHKTGAHTGKGYSASLAFRAFEALVYTAARDYLDYHYNAIPGAPGADIRYYFPKNTVRRAVAETLQWRCEARMAAGEFGYQQFVNRPLSSNLSRYEIGKLVAKQNELGRELTKRDIGKVLTPYRYKDPHTFDEPKNKPKK